MSTIVTRSGKGSALTHTEMDANFTNLNTDKLQDIVEDTSPQLGANLDLNSFDITGTGDIDIAGEITGTEFIGNLRGANLMKSSAGEALTKGDVVYISGISGNTPVVSKADADDSSKMPAVGLANATVSSSAAVDVLTFGQIVNIDTTQNIGGTWAEGDSLYVNTVAGQLTKTQPSGETGLVQKIAKIEKVHASTGLLLIQGAGRTNATPNLNDGNIFIGDGSNYSSTTPFAISLDATPQLAGNLDVNGNSIVSVGAGNINITPDTTGVVILDGITYPAADGTAGQLLKTDGAGNLSFVNAGGFDGDLAGDTLTDSTQGVTIDASSVNKLKFENTDANPGSILMNTFAFSSNGTMYIPAAIEFRTPADKRLFKLEARGSADDGTHNAYFYLTGASNQFLSKNEANNAYVPLELRSSQVKIYNGTSFNYILPTADGSADQVIKTDGNGNLSFTTASGGMSNLVDDTSPQLGGTLDMNGSGVTNSGSTGRVAVIGTGGLGVYPDGTGVTNPQFLVEDNGSDSIKITMKASSTDVVGNQIESLIGSGARGPFSFNAAATNFNSTSTIVFDATTSQSIKISNNNLIVIDANRIQLEKPTAPPTLLTTNLPTANMQGGELANVSNNQNKLVYYDNSASAWRYVGTDGLV